MMPTHTRRVAAGLLAAALSATALAGCSTAGDPQSGDKVTITLSGPNQWNSDPASFGPEWEAQIARFQEQEPNIEVKTTVLPLSSFKDTLATQLSAGTASELVFNQAPFETYMVHDLTEYLDKPNPYVEGNAKWSDVFEQDLYGPGNSLTYNTDGSVTFVPFNVFVPVVYYNTEAFEKAGISAPPTTWAEFIDASAKLVKAGYVPFAADNAPQGLGWTYSVIFDQLMTDVVYDKLNKYDGSGAEGSSPSLTQKDWARGVKTGEVDATKIPEVRESLELLKQFYENVTPNWSGVTGEGASIINKADFLSGNAAMAWGSSFAYASASSEASFPIASMPFPTITKETTSLSSNTPARFGASIYGTAYMIPSTVEGAKLDAAVKFLQFMTAPEKVSPWLDATGSLSALNGVDVPDNMQAFVGTEWLAPRKSGPSATYPVKGQTVQDLYGGYLLGTKSTDQMLADLQASWEAVADQDIASGGWTEDWTKN